jgi:hypothetical protein
VRGVDRVGSTDLLIGILLADRTDLEDSPARRLFEHFQVPLGEVVGDDPPTEQALLRVIRGLPLDVGAVPVESSVQVVLDSAGRLPTEEPSYGVSVRTLFGALLAESGPASSAIARAFERRGVDYGTVVTAYRRDYLRGEQTYADFLREHHPYRPPRVELPGYLADQPQSRVDDAEDLVGVGTEVDAFAHLMASKRLVPPLAIGLFGDWGSGKSYFLRALQRRIDRLAAAPPDAPFHRSVVQIEFNAWQYVGGDLWAGLVEHLFRNLRIAGDVGNDLVAERQRYWIEQVQDLSADHQKALVDQADLEKRRSAAEGLVAERQREREKKLAELERTRRERPLAGWRPTVELRTQVATSLGLEQVGENAAALQEELDRAREDLRGLGAVLGPLRAGGWRYGLAVVFVVLLAPLVIYLSGLVDLSEVAGAVAGLLTTLAGYLAVAGRYARSATDKIAKAQAELAEAEQRKREELDQEVLDAEKALTTAQTNLDAAEVRERKLAVELAVVTESLAESTPRQVLTDFINERLGSEDYRKHLGVPALVRRDLERLSLLVAAQQDETSGATVPGHQYAIDRVVLYIDDLDRCPTPLVIKVLEAVHLLLAFRLFVVVVAVDARWLESSLREHYRQLDGEGANPEDYLEKIFQVPFWLRPLDTGVRERMLRGLLAPSLAEPEDLAAGAAGDGVEELSATDLKAFHEVVASFAVTEDRARAGADTVDLTVSAEEIDQIEDVAELVGTTPRAVKRFVNVYLLLRSMGTARGWQVPEHGLLVVLLAISSGLPKAFAEVQGALRLGDIRHEAFQTWLQARPGKAEQSLRGLSDWTDLITRFRFARTG